MMPREGRMWERMSEAVERELHMWETFREMRDAEAQTKDPKAEPCGRDEYRKLVILRRLLDEWTEEE